MADGTRWLSVPPEKILILDTETTGLDSCVDEVLSLAIVDGLYGTVFQGSFRPARVSSWPAAQAVNGIAPEDVAQSDALVDHAADLTRILCGCELLAGYNIMFDLHMLANDGVRVPCGHPTLDVMEEFAALHGAWDRERNRHRATSLANCAKYYGCTYRAHTALGDARATLYCLNRLREERLGRV